MHVSNDYIFDEFVKKPSFKRPVRLIYTGKSLGRTDMLFKVTDDARLWGARTFKDGLRVGYDMKRDDALLERAIDMLTTYQEMQHYVIEASKQSPRACVVISNCDEGD